MQQKNASQIIYISFHPVIVLLRLTQFTRVYRWNTYALARITSSNMHLIVCNTIHAAFIAFNSAVVCYFEVLLNCVRYC